jgi:hypothetical protein
MTKQKLNIFTKGFGLVSAILLLATGFLVNLPTEARLADSEVVYSTPIPKDRTAPINVQFGYGSVTADSDISTPITKVTLDKPDFEFVNTGFQDWYNGSPTRTDAENPPAQPVCNNTFTGNKYPISSSLVSTSEFTYGLQSARNLSAQSGAASVDKLREKHTGCINVSFKVAANATVGSQVKLTFDEDFGNSPSYAENNRPGKRSIVFTIGAAQNSSSSSSAVASSVASSVAVSSTRTSSTAAVSSRAVTSTTPLPASSVTPVKTDLDRTGGAEVAVVIAMIASGIVGFIVFKVYKKRISKVDVGGGNFKGKK